MAEKTEVFRIKVEGTQDVLRLEQELKKLKAEARKTTDKTVFAQLAEEIVKTQAALKDARREQNQAINEVLSVDKGVGAYKRLSAQLNATKKELKDLAADGRANTQQFREQLLAAQKLDRQLKMIDASVGEFGRNVGNYAGSLKGFFGQLKAQIQSSGFGGRGGIQMFATQLFNGASRLIDTIDKINTQFSSTALIHEKVKQATKGAIDEFVNERKELDTLVVALVNTNTPIEKKREILQTLNEKYPDYFKNLDAEKVKVDKVMEGYKGANNQILAGIRQRLVLNTIEEQAKDALEKKIEAQKASNLQTAYSKIGAPDLTTSVLINLNATYAETTAKAAKSAMTDFATIDKFAKEITDVLAGTFGDFELAIGDVNTITTKTSQKNAKENAKTQEQLRKEYDTTVEAAKRARDEYLKSEAEFQKQQLDSITQMQGAIKQAVVDNIEDEGERALAQEKLNYEILKAQREAQHNDLIARAKKQEQDLLKIYSEGTPEVVAFRTTVAAQLQQLDAQFKALSEQQEQAHQNKLKQIQEDGQQARTDSTESWHEQQLALDAQYISELTMQYDRLTTEIDAQLTRGVISTEEAERKKFEIRKQYIEEQIKMLDAQLQLEMGLTEGQTNSMIAERERLKNELLTIEAQEDNRIAEGISERGKEIIKKIQIVLGYVSQGIDAINGLLNAANAAETKRLDDQIATREKNIENLEKQLEKASGLQKAFLQGQIDEETRQAEQLAQQKAAIEKKAAKRNKAIGIIQAIINTALGVSQALASLPPPASFITAAITGALGAVQIATIAAQPLATGGVVGQNITGKPIKRSNGDNVLTTLKTGEVVLNKKQQARLGGAPIFRAIGVPGFAGGGLVGSSQSVRGAIGMEMADFTEIVNRLDAKTDAIAAMIPKIEVVHTTRTQESIDKDKKEVQTIRQLNKLA